MEDIQCPHCDTSQDVNHDDGYGYDQDSLNSQQCSGCDKFFAYRTTIIFRYEAEKADCLNNGNHQWKPTITFPKEFTKMQCQTCEDERPMNEEERKLFSTEAEASQ